MHNVNIKFADCIGAGLIVTGTLKFLFEVEC
nr:MAG TPA: hypothetical protein [Caudoviricetes sp.]